MKAAWCNSLRSACKFPQITRIVRNTTRSTCANETSTLPISLMSPGDILFLYTDGVYDGSDKQMRELLEWLLREHHRRSAREICNAFLDWAVQQDNHLRENGD